MSGRGSRLGTFKTSAPYGSILYRQRCGRDWPLSFKKSSDTAKQKRAAARLSRMPRSSRILGRQCPKYDPKRHMLCLIYCLRPWRISRPHTRSQAIDKVTGLRNPRQGNKNASCRCRGPGPLTVMRQMSEGATQSRLLFPTAGGKTGRSAPTFLVRTCATMPLRRQPARVSEGDTPTLRHYYATESFEKGRRFETASSSCFRHQTSTTTADFLYPPDGTGGVLCHSAAR